MKKKLLSVLLASTMLLGTATTAFAEEVNVEVAAETTDATADAADAAAAETAGITADDEALVGASDEEGTGIIDLSTVTMSSNVANPGDSIVITCKTANVERIHFYYYYHTTSGEQELFQTHMGDYDAENGNTSIYDAATGTWTITMRIPADAATEVWELNDIQMSDGNGNYTYVSAWDTDLSKYSISVGGAAAATPATPVTPAVSTTPTADFYIASMDNNGVVAGMTTNISASTLEYRWLYYDIDADVWGVAQDWTANNEWLNWKPAKNGAFLLQGEVRDAADTSKTAHQCVGINYHCAIKGKCQMPYEGGGYLIGVESFNNPGYQYEMLILDCTLLAEGKDAWTYTTGKCGVSDGNAFWTVWQPQYGYYWTLFRIYDANGNLVDEDCYGFQNI